LRTEISAKFRPEGVREEVRRAGFDLRRLWRDPHGDFGLALSVPI
jgi:L-histidine N-alpha-methyltransferase